MGILMLNKSTCNVCNQVLNKPEEIISFPPFAVNTCDPIFFFSDNNFHANCLKQYTGSDKAIYLAGLFLHSIKPENRICIIDNKLIKRPEEQLFIDLLSSDETDKLYYYNFLNINKKNIPLWDKREELLSSLKDLNDNIRWKETDKQNKYLHTLIELLKVI